MNRRTFIKRSGLVIPMIFIPRLIRASAPANLNPAFFHAKPSSSGGDITTGLVARWKGDEGSGTTAVDATGNGHTGTAMGSPAWTTGKIGAHAFSYDGSSGFTFSAITTGTTFTYAAWVNCKSGGGGYQNLMSQGNLIGLWMRGQQIDFYFSGDHSSSGTIPLNEWHHIAVVCNSGNVTFYIDGVADATTYNSAPSFDANAMGMDSTFSEGFNGYQDDVRLYSRALPQADITALAAFSGP